MWDLKQSQLTGDRFDPATYEMQLLAVSEECSSLAEKHNRDLVPYFLALVEPDTPSRLPRTKLSVWLKLFAKFSNPMRSVRRMLCARSTYRSSRALIVRYRS